MTVVVCGVVAGLALRPVVSVSVTTFGAGVGDSPGPKRQATKNSTPIATTAISATRTALDDSRRCVIGRSRRLRKSSSSCRVPKREAYSSTNSRPSRPR